MGLDDALGDWKAEPGAEPPSLGCLPEPVKDMRQVLGRDTGARIRNSEDDLVIPRGRTDRDPPPAFVNLIALPIRFSNT